MQKLIPITGTVTELSNCHLGKHWTEYGTVHIREDSGQVTRVQDVLVTSEMPNALNVGTHGTFYFRKVRSWGRLVGRRRLLAACEANGYLRTASVRNAIVVNVFAVVMSVVLIPFVIGMVAFPVALAIQISFVRTQLQIRALERRLSANSEVLRVRTV